MNRQEKDARYRDNELCRVDVIERDTYRLIITVDVKTDMLTWLDIMGQNQREAFDWECLDAVRGRVMAWERKCAEYKASHCHKCGTLQEPAPCK